MGVGGQGLGIGAMTIQARQCALARSLRLHYSRGPHAKPHQRAKGAAPQLRSPQSPIPDPRSLRISE